jgi:hypothetical protein
MIDCPKGGENTSFAHRTSGPAVWRCQRHLDIRLGASIDSRQASTGLRVLKLSHFFRAAVMSLA